MFKMFFLLLLVPIIGNAASFKYGGLKLDVATLNAAGSTTILTASSSQVEVFTATTQNQTVRLPAATTLAPGYWFGVTNEGSGTITVTDGATAVLATIAASSSSSYILISTSTTAGTWGVGN